MPGHRTRNMDVDVTWEHRSGVTPANDTANLKRLDVINGVENTAAPINCPCKNEISGKYAVTKAARTYAARFSSRDGAVLRHAILSKIQEADVN